MKEECHDDYPCKGNWTQVDGVSIKNFEWTGLLFADADPASKYMPTVPPVLLKQNIYGYVNCNQPSQTLKRQEKHNAEIM